MLCQQPGKDHQLAPFSQLFRFLVQNGTVFKQTCSTSVAKAKVQISTIYFCASNFSFESTIFGGLKIKRVISMLRCLRAQKPKDASLDLGSEAPTWSRPIAAVHPSEPSVHLQVAPGHLPRRQDAPQPVQSLQTQEVYGRWHEQGW